MAIELSRHVAHLLATLSPDHPDRAFLVETQQQITGHILARLESSDPRVQDVLGYHLNSDILKEPIPGGDWNDILKTTHGEEVAALLGHVYQPEHTLRLEEPIQGVDAIAKGVLRTIGEPVWRVKTVSIDELQAEANSAYSQSDTRRGHDATDEKKLSGYIDSLIPNERSLPNLIYGYLEDSLDIEKFFLIDYIFFQRMYQSGIQDRFKETSAASPILSKIYRDVVRYEATLVASGSHQAERVTELRKLMERGNYPIGIDKDGILKIVTA